jgi:hypothetical protein
MRAGRKQRSAVLTAGILGTALLTDRVLRGLHAPVAGLVAELPASRLAGVLLLFPCLVSGLALEPVKMPMIIPVHVAE